MRKFILMPLLLLAGCFTDAATRIAYDIEAGAQRIAQVDGARLSLAHRTPSRSGECEGNYTVQLDQVGAIIIWCRDKQDRQVVSSHSTSYHRRFVDTLRTFILEKKAGETLFIELERRDGRTLITEAK
ncbi:MAG TPA: hypothetical protein DEO56_04185 [Nitrosomonas nitrosa]|jgi:hypothetical protein|uniref:Heat shock protein HslJ n=1 Tax=Nitrosomonas nitrosa TaxID=52442 RepID=A0A1I4USW3_9PROT|nr:hypothetical protein [Nitrosomonas nitrosa]MCO6434196.1 hypothetical protein [Nitrosomonas nitrosa]PTR04814.1 hypothetical protein C8R30_1019 [Nitrosomonas nitrosa]CAE6486703.1 conserved exported hypothetical protein [Nitrosomonas nitrosa]SFM92067.1 hypothetical protein SAMN05421880_1542 [Nitrosomonas nitrosa]HBZ29779.1 hypothetical protein [Nitrosomonas nitrosa]